jgi:hypothetical protein
MFMSRRPFLWLHITALCSGDEHGCEKWLTDSLRVKYDQKQDKGSFFINMTTALPPSGRVRVQTETFSGSTGRSLSTSTVPKRAKWQDRRIIPANIWQKRPLMRVFLAMS